MSSNEEFVFDVSGYRVVDLSKPLYPHRERRRLEIRRALSSMNDYHSEIDLMSHLGTHVEAPYHVRDDWRDTYAVGLDRYMGRCVRLDITDIMPAAEIGGKELDRADRGEVRAGDFIIISTPYYLEPFTEKTNTVEDERPYLSEKAALWMHDKKIKGVGFDNSVSIERSLEDVAVFHDILMREDVVFIEVMQNFHLLSQKVFFLAAQPIPIIGLDSCPVRAVAIEGIL